MAKYDLPAMLEYALNISGQAQLFYIGHSQGTLTGFEAFSTNLKLAKKVKLFVALAPIFYLNHTSAFARDVAFTLYPFEVIKLKLVWNYWLDIRYRNIPKISPSMYKPLQI